MENEIVSMGNTMNQYLLKEFGARAKKSFQKRNMKITNKAEGFRLNGGSRKNMGSSLGTNLARGRG
jgi:hypothetical protein